MAISTAYRRGYKRAIQAASKLAAQRKIAHETAAKIYAREKPNEPYWQWSETCAAREATFIREEILKLRPKDEVTEGEGGR